MLQKDYAKAVHVLMNDLLAWTRASLKMAIECSERIGSGIDGLALETDEEETLRIMKEMAEDLDGLSKIHDDMSDYLMRMSGGLIYSDRLWDELSETDLEAMGYTLGALKFKDMDDVFGEE